MTTYMFIAEWVNSMLAVKYDDATMIGIQTLSISCVNIYAPSHWQKQIGEGKKW